jgi:hypothetical protein
LNTVFHDIKTLQNCARSQANHAEFAAPTSGISQTVASIPPAFFRRAGGDAEVGHGAVVATGVYRSLGGAVGALVKVERAFEPNAARAAARPARDGLRHPP